MPWFCTWNIPASTFPLNVTRATALKKQIFYFGIQLFLSRKGAWPPGSGMLSPMRWSCSGCSRSKVAILSGRRRWRSAGTASTRETASSSTWVVWVRLCICNLHIIYIIMWCDCSFHRLFRLRQSFYDYEKKKKINLQEIFNFALLSSSYCAGDFPVVWLPEQPLREAEGHSGRQGHPWQRAQWEESSLCLWGGGRARKDDRGEISELWKQMKLQRGFCVEVAASVLRCWVLNQICLSEPLMISKLTLQTGRGPNSTRWEAWEHLRHTCCIIAKKCIYLYEVILDVQNCVIRQNNENTLLIL